MLSTPNERRLHIYIDWQDGSEDREDRGQVTADGSPVILVRRSIELLKFKLNTGLRPIELSSSFSPSQTGLRPTGRLPSGANVSFPPEDVLGIHIHSGNNGGPKAREACLAHSSSSSRYVLFVSTSSSYYISACESGIAWVGDSISIPFAFEEASVVVVRGADREEKRMIEFLSRWLRPRFFSMRIPSVVACLTYANCTLYSRMITTHLTPLDIHRGAPIRARQI